MTSETSIEVAPSFVEKAEIIGEGNESGKEGIEGNSHAQSSLTKAIFSVFCAGAGAGIVGLPYALRSTGWYGVILLALAAVACVYTAYKMAFCFNDDLKLKTYNDFGEKAFGKWGRMLVLICQIGVCIGSGILYLVLAGQNLATVFNFLPLHAWHWTLICGAVVIPLCYLKTLHDAAYVAAFGALASVLVVVVLMVEIFRTDDSQKTFVYNDISFQGILKGFATITFAYGAHSVFPSVQRTMKKPQRFGLAALIAFIAMFVLYTLTACIGYYAFGINTRGNVLDNLSASAPAAIIIRVALTIHVLFAYVVFANPIFELMDDKVEEFCKKRDGQTSRPNTHADNDTISEDIKNPDGPEMGSVVMSVPEKSAGCCDCLRRIPAFTYIVFFRTLLVIITLILAIVIPFFGDLMSLIGASTVSASIFMMPAGFFLKIYWRRISWLERIACIAIVVIGTFAAIVGSIFAIMDIVSHASSYKLFQ